MNMNEIQTQTNSYLTFRLGDETFAASVTKVLNILEMTKITKVPKAPPYMKGVINLRGSVLPLIDTRIKFGMSATEFSTNTCILVLDLILNEESVKVGALADSVQEVLEIREDQIQSPPSIGTKFKSDFVEGMARIGEDFIMLLDVEQIFSTDEIVSIKGASGNVNTTD